MRKIYTKQMESGTFKKLAASALKDWSVDMTARLRTACRHYTQAVLKSGGKAAWLRLMAASGGGAVQKKRKGRKDDSDDEDEGEYEKDEEEGEEEEGEDEKDEEDEGEDEKDEEEDETEEEKGIAIEYEYGYSAEHQRAWRCVVGGNSATAS